MKKIIVFIILALLVLSGCNVTQLAPKAPDIEGDGTLVILIDDGSLNSRFATIAPDDLVPDTYTLTGTKIDALDSFSIIGSADTVHVLNGLEAGDDWSVLIEAFGTINSIPGTLIASGNTSFEIVYNANTLLDITLLPLTTSTTEVLNLTLSWPADSIPVPSAIAKLVPDGLDPILDAIPVTFGPFDILNGSATSTNTGLAPGYYDLYIELYDDGVLAAADVGTVRIVQGVPTDGIAAFLSLATGSAQFTILTDLDNPFSLVFTVPQTILDKSLLQSMNVTVTPEAGGTLYSYRWFLNGVEQALENANTITMDSNLLPVGFHRLTAIVNRDGALSSGTVTFTVDP